MQQSPRCERTQHKINRSALGSQYTLAAWCIDDGNADFPAFCSRSYC